MLKGGRKSCSFLTLVFKQATLTVQKVFSPNTTCCCLLIKQRLSVLCTKSQATGAMKRPRATTWEFYRDIGGLLGQGAKINPTQGRKWPVAINSNRVMLWHESSYCDCLFPSWSTASSTPPICTSTSTHKHACTHTRRQINAPTRMSAKCRLLWDFYTSSFSHGSSIPRVSGFLWTWPWMTSLPVGSFTGVLTGCVLCEMCAGWLVL